MSSVVMLQPTVPAARLRPQLEEALGCVLKHRSVCHYREQYLLALRESVIATRDSQCKQLWGAALILLGMPRAEVERMLMH